MSRNIDNIDSLFRTKMPRQQMITKSRYKEPAPTYIVAPPATVENHFHYANRPQTNLLQTFFIAFTVAAASVIVLILLTLAR